MTSAKWKPLAILALAAAALFALLYFTKNPEASAAEAKERVALLEDSINALNGHVLYRTGSKDHEKSLRSQGSA